MLLILAVLSLVSFCGELAQSGQSVRMLNGRSCVQITYSLIISYWRNLYRKKENNILLISKEIALKLNKEYGVPYGEGGISTTGKLNGRHKYYLCESKKNMILLEKVTK